MGVELTASSLLEHAVDDRDHYMALTEVAVIVTPKLFVVSKVSVTGRTLLVLRIWLVETISLV